MAHSARIREILFDPEAAETKAGEIYERFREPVRILLHYCYGADVSGEAKGETAEAVLELACKYGVAGLKSVMEEYLADSVCTNNVVKMAELALKHSAQDLRKVGEVARVLVHGQDTIHPLPGMRGHHRQADFGAEASRLAEVARR